VPLKAAVMPVGGVAFAVYDPRRGASTWPTRVFQERPTSSSASLTPRDQLATRRAWARNPSEAASPLGRCTKLSGQYR